MIVISFPDGSRREFESGTTGEEIASSISPSLRKRSAAMLVDGKVDDLSRPLERDASVEFVGRDDSRVLETLRHDCAHVMAEAVQRLFPDAKTAIGPPIENGFYYDFEVSEPFVPDDLPRIEEEMRRIVKANCRFEREEWERNQAHDHFGAKGETYKRELIDGLSADAPLSIYRQGEWLDLCRGPHLDSTGRIGDAFRLTKIAGAYWRGDSSRRMLQRIYGTAFADSASLESHLERVAEAERRDHRRLGREMSLFHFQEEAPGAAFWHPKGWTMFRVLVDYMRRRQERAGYLEVNAPDMLDASLWEKSGHWDKFKEHMFLAKNVADDLRELAFKPMNCPGHVQIFSSELRSYRDLPLRFGEFGKVHRYEPSGALHGLLRVRSFTQDDAHIFCSEDDLASECAGVHHLMTSIYSDFGFDEFRVKFSDRPPSRVGSDAVWDRSEHALRSAVEDAGGVLELNSGEGAFYGPKLEYILTDAIGREWQCGTLQADFNMTERLGAFYIAPDGSKTTPVMLHRAMFGSLERFIGILLEHHAGRLPMWLSPTSAVVATITDAASDYAHEVVEACAAKGLRAAADVRNEKISYKVREHSAAKIPAILAVGAKEVSERSVSVRRLGATTQEAMPLEKAINDLAEEATPPDLK